MTSSAGLSKQPHLGLRLTAETFGTLELIDDVVQLSTSMIFDTLLHPPPQTSATHDAFVV
jgi:hypothetical protein